MSKNTVWVLAENWRPRRGGIESYLMHVAEYLARSGFKVTAIVPISSVIKDTISGVVEIQYRMLWPIIKPAWLPLFLQLWKRAKSERPSVIICGKGLFEGLVGYYFKKYLGIPYVVCTYALEINTWQAHKSTRRKLIRVLKSALLVTHISNVIKNILSENGVLESQLYHLQPGVDIRFCNKVSDSLIKSTGLFYGIKGRYVLAVARLAKRKGLDVVIEAFSQIDQTRFADVKLVIVGDGPESTEIESLIDELYMSTSVVLLKDVPDKHLPALYAGAELFALVPRTLYGDVEGFGIVYLEAGACSTPVIGSRSGGVAEAVEENKTGILVPENDIAETTNAIEDLLSNKARCQQLGNFAHDKICSKATWDVQVTKFVSILRQKLE